MEFYQINIQFSNLQRPTRHSQIENMIILRFDCTDTVVMTVQVVPAVLRPVCLSVFLPVCVFVYVCLSVYCVYVCMCIFVCTNMCVFVCMFFCTYISV